MRTLSIDIETFSSVNLLNSGGYAYTEGEDFEILLFAYAFDDDEVKIVDFTKGEKLSQELVDALKDENIIKTAFNAAFERVCLSKYLNIKLSATSWHCTQVQSLMVGLPTTLDKVGQVLNVNSPKMKEGKSLIKLFTLPCNPSEKNNFKRRNLPEDNPEKWEIFKDYCINDVKCEMEIRNKLNNYHISDDELKLYVLDQEINDRGILVDVDFVDYCLKCDLIYKIKIKNKFYKLTNLNNTNSLQQLKNYLYEKGVETKKLDKKSVEKLIEKSEGEVCEVLKLRQALSKTSVKKYESIKRCICKDKRVHGLFQFYGASRTGRWAGRLVQVQNLPQNHIKDLNLARELVKNGRYEDVKLLYPSTEDVLSQLIRTAFVPRDGCEFIVADFSAIEARVLAWIANEKWRIDTFKSHGKIYEASAAQMFNLAIEEITKESDLRQKGKIAELALGYGGSVGALKVMGALDMNLKEEELLPLVQKWRRVNANITNFWWKVGDAAIEAVKYSQTVRVGKIIFEYKDDILFIELPSKRKLAYRNPRLGINKFGKTSLTYKGMSQNKKYERIETYGPKLVENIVQGISRDILANAMVNLRDKGFDIVMHVHDEVVVEVEKGKTTVEDVCEIMTSLPDYVDGLPLKAEGYTCEFYKK